MIEHTHTCDECQIEISTHLAEFCTNPDGPEFCEPCLELADEERAQELEEEEETERHEPIV